MHQTIGLTTNGLL